MKKIAIKGDGTEETGKKIIKYLESLGGDNCIYLSGCSLRYYYINDAGRICGDILKCPIGYTLIPLPSEPQEPTFPRRMLVSNEPDGGLDGFEERTVLFEKDGFYHAVSIESESDYKNDSFRDYCVYKWNYAKELPKESESEVQIRELQAQVAQISETIKKLKEVDRCSR
jgi:hypothetical protein